MDQFLSHLIYELNLELFDVSYEKLVTVTCCFKWTQNTPSVKIEFTSNIMKYLLPTNKIDKHYLILQSRIKDVVEIYWREIVEETLGFKRIRV